MNGKARLNGSPYSTPPVPASRAHALRLAHGLRHGPALARPVGKGSGNGRFQPRNSPPSLPELLCLPRPGRKETRGGAAAGSAGYRPLPSATAIGPSRRATRKQSELIRRVSSDDADERMPPPSTGKRLTAQEIDRLSRWIRQGATYTPHWAYVKPVRPQPPQVGDRAWPKNDSRSLPPCPPGKGEAPSHRRRPTASTLIRRLSLDLTGLPPTIAEVDQFVHATGPRRL